MKRSFTIKSTLFLALLIGIIAPMLLLAAYTINANTNKLTSEFNSFREEITYNISNSMRDPLYYFSPNNASLVLELIKLDERIAKIEVYDSLSDTHFIIIDFPDRKLGNIYENKADVARDDELLGWVKIQFSDHKFQSTLGKQKELFARVCLMTIFVSISLLGPLLYFKILSPLKKLLTQSKEFENNKFEIEHTWTKDDEINILGQSFENARLSILDLVSKLQDKNKELKKLYATDQLTALYNRHKLDRVLNHEIEKTYRHPDYQFGVILVDLDHFKRINDTYGHQIGDYVLQAVASIFKENIRNLDVAGRWGGEEFLFIIPFADEENVIQLAEKIREVIACHDFNGIESLTASFGVTLYRPPEDIATCIARADTALYQAKDQGRNKVMSCI